MSFKTSMKEARIKNFYFVSNWKWRASACLTFTQCFWMKSNTMPCIWLNCTNNFHKRLLFRILNIVFNINKLMACIFFHLNFKYYNAILSTFIFEMAKSLPMYIEVLGAKGHCMPTLFSKWQSLWLMQYRKFIPNTLKRPSWYKNAAFHRQLY